MQMVADVGELVDAHAEAPRERAQVMAYRAVQLGAQQRPASGGARGPEHHVQGPLGVDGTGGLALAATERAAVLQHRGAERGGCEQRERAWQRGSGERGEVASDEQRIARLERRSSEIAMGQCYLACARGRPAAGPGGGRSRRIARRSACARSPGSTPLARCSMPATRRRVFIHRAVCQSTRRALSTWPTPITTASEESTPAGTLPPLPEAAQPAQITGASAMER